MKPISNQPSHVHLEENLTMDKFANFLKQKGDTESKNIFAGKHKHSGVSLLHRLPTQSDGQLARLSYFFRFSSERNEARQQIKTFLKREVLN
jgi:hypothetical protein